ncbi:sensor histidine kinase [Nocardia alba]|uniref:Signal transduction histidine kinase n=1 Tax=Nocardia alba TaxID=225051 RepID=A0A4V2PBF3_9NOCA|nr:ATP-binding protein [Nocardia alba]TCJ97195.1 signal transduction histidine kinase [Nocardia alba]
MVAREEMNRAARESAHASYEQVLRSLARLIAVAFGAYALLLASRIIVDSAFVAWWWTIASVLAVLVAPAVLLFQSAQTRSVAALRRIAMSVPAMFLGVALLWPLAWNGTPLPGSLWLSFVPGLAAMSAALAWQSWFAVLYLLVATGAVQLLNQNRASTANFAFGLEMLYSFGFSLVFVAMVLEGLRTARMLDRTRTATLHQAEATAAAETRAAQRRIHDNVVHDWAIATLLAAVQLQDSERTRREARFTLAKMDAMPLVSSARPVTAEAVVESLRSAIAEVAPAIVVEAVMTAEHSELDADAVRAAVTGAAEAVRNSVRHSHTGVRCSVHAVVGACEFRVTVSDDGPGFDPSATPAGRFGIRGTIRQLEHIDGGTVAVESAPGEGTRVQLAWRRPVAAGGPDIRQFLGIRTRSAVLVAATYLVGIAALAVMSTHGALGIAAVIALLSYSAMAVWFVMAAHDPVSRWVGLGVALGPVGTAVAVWGSAALHSPEQLWPASATAAIYALLILRGRPAMAWCGQVGVVAVCTVWAANEGFDAVPLVVSRLADFAPMVGATAFARIVRPRLQHIVELREESVQLARRESVARAAVAERRQRRRAFDLIARPILTEIAHSDSLTDRARRASILLEARLRDELRGGILSTPVLAQAIHLARERGVEVLLYDDHGADDCPIDTRTELFAAVTTELAAAEAGQFIVRIGPPGRDLLATVVARTPEGTRRRSIARTASVARAATGSA